MRTLKILICSLATVCVGAVAAPAALAVPQLHSEVEHTILTGQQTTANELSLDVGLFQCQTIQFGGTIAVPTTTTFSLTPKFEGCILDGMEALFTHNGCNWRFHVGPNEEHLTGTVDFVCPDNQVMQIDSPACVVTIPPQAGLQGVTYGNENAGETRSIVLGISLGGIDYVEHGNGCANNTETTNNGTYTGKVTVTGEGTMGAHKGIWIE
jgi:hypothetical protein